MKRLNKISQIQENDKYNELYNKLSNIYPEIEKAEYIGTMTAHDCDKNSFKMRKEYDVYIGYILFFSTDYNEWTVTSHVFNCKNGQVYEFTDLYNTDFNNVHYFGEKIDNKNLKLKTIWDNQKRL